MRTPRASTALRALLAVCVFTLSSPLSSLLAQSAPNSSARNETSQGPVAQADRVLDETPGRSARVRIAGHIPAWASASADLGPVPDSKPIHLTIGISRSPAVQAAFAQFIVEQQRAGSPHFHQWLTPEQIGAQYGPTQHDLDAVTRWLSSQGFVIDSISPSRVAIRVTAPAGVAANALHTQLHFFLSNGRNLQSPTFEPAVPAALAPVVAYIAGLADVPYTTDVHVQRAPAPPSTRGLSSTSFSQSGAANPDYTASDGTNYQFPDDFNAIYDIAPLLATGNTGTGQRVAVLGGSRLAASDLTTWESLSNLPAYQPNYVIPPGQTDPQETNDGNQDEGTLDFERAHGTAPGATIDMLIAQNWLDFTVTNDLLNYEINTLRDPVLTLSFGICEAQVTSSYVQSEDTLFMQAAAQGISVFVSSGDSGVAGCEVHGQPAPSTPQIASINADCASSYVTCVGGTQFSDLASPTTYWSATNGPGDGSALGYIPEGSFNEPDGQTAGTFQIFASGGGPSTFIHKPTWQTGTGVPQDGFRDTPDISFSSSSHDGYFGCLAYLGGDCSQSQGGFVFSGTSAAAPSMAGIAALINQKTGASQGNFNPLLYRTATLAPADFHDATPATSGVAACSTATPSTCNNSTPGPTSLSGGLAGFSLTAGYDLATGLGSLDVLKLASTSALPVAATVVTASPSTITISQTVVFTATVTGSGGVTPTGTVQFFSNGSALGNPVTLSGGVATSPAESFPLAATYSITANYSGDSSFNGSDSAAFSLVVTNPNAVASTTTLTVTPTTATTAQVLTFTAAVTGSKGTATGTIQFLVDGAPQGVAVPLVNGSATLTGAPVAPGTHSITAFYAGDDNYSASTSNAVSITITALSSSTSISISPSTIATTDTVTFSTTVTGSGGGPVPTGTVTLMQSTQSLGSLTLVNGSASGQLSGGGGNPFPVGTFPFDFVYSGDAVYNGSTSPIANLTVTAGTGSGSGTISLTANLSSLAASAGASATDSLTVHSTNFSGTQTFTCTIAFNGSGAAASAPTCLVAPTSVTVASNSTASATLTVSTTAAHAITRGGASENRSLPLGPLGGITLAALFFGILPRSRRKLRIARVLSALVFLAGSLTLLSGCGSGGNYNSGSGGGGTPATTAGSYTVTVAANSAAGQSTNVSATLTIPLTVQ